MMMACLLIIIACMAQYCNYWRKRKTPIDGDIIADVSRRVGRLELEEEWKTNGWVGNSIPPYTTINYLLKAAGICLMSNEETQEFGLQLGLRKVVVVFVVLNMCWGEWVGVYI